MGCSASNAVEQADIPCIENKPVRPVMLEPELPPLTPKSALGTPIHDDSVVLAAPLSRTPPVPSGEMTFPGKMFTAAFDFDWVIYRVLSFLPLNQTVSAVVLCASTYHCFQPRRVRGQYWRHMCDTLRAQSRLHLPADNAELLLVANGSFKGLFEELWPARARFVKVEENEGANVLERFHVQTFCRMRPEAQLKADGFSAAELFTSAPVQLPLNQRVALLRQKNPSLTHGAAVKMLLNKQCGAGEALPEDEELQIPGVADDFRPLTGAARPQTSMSSMGMSMTGFDFPGQQANAGGATFNSSVLSVNPGPKGSVLTVSPGIGIRSWDFAHVFNHTSTQRQLYEHCGLRLVTNLLNGQSGALIVYGQTGSGKTHTMFGPPGNADGLVTRITDDVLANMQHRRCDGFEVSLGVSIVEVFGNDVTNLLGGDIGANRGENQRMGHRYILDGQCEETVDNREGFAELLARGEERKRSAKTEMNERSTRAHTLVILRLKQRLADQERYVESTLTLVDLGGSERVSKSKANEDVKAPGAINVGNGEQSRVSWREYYSSRERITETNHINKGLMTLKRCVQALNERQQCSKQGKPLPRVPFHDSKLTMLLQPALCGEACTSIVVCCSPEDRHAEETAQSLRFGEMCSAVEHEHSNSNRDANADVTKAIKQLDAEIKELEAEILRKEKWEWRMKVREDVIDEMDTAGALCHKDEVMELGGAGAVEIRKDDGSSKKNTVEHQVWAQVAVGAEAENARRDELLATRARLLGLGEA